MTMDSAKQLDGLRPGGAGGGEASSDSPIVEPATSQPLPNHTGSIKPKPASSKDAKKKKASAKPSPLSDSSSSEDEDDSGSSSDSSSVDSATEQKLMRMLKKRKAARKKVKAKSRRSKRTANSDSSSDSYSSGDSSSDDYDSDESSEPPSRRKRSSGKSKSRNTLASMQPHDFAALTLAAISGAQNRQRQALPPPPPPAQVNPFSSIGGDPLGGFPPPLDDVGGLPPMPGTGSGLPPPPAIGNPGESSYQSSGNRKKKPKHRKGKRGATLDFKRVDQLWDRTIHDYKLTERAEAPEKIFDGFVFTVRRKFDWQNKYKNTVVDIKSKRLREALQVVLADAKGVSLVEDEPSIEPNMLFLYMDELHEYSKKTLKEKIKTETKKKLRKRLEATRAECKLLLKYLNEDYADVKKRLHPMVKAGNITFDLVWALFKPNTIAYASTYGASEHPRCFKVDYSTKNSDFTRGEWYGIEGRYLEYDGKSFGLGDLEVDIPAFKGPRKITSLATYPLEYHSDPERIRKQLIERGKKFVSLEGMNYRFHNGLAFAKKRRHIVKINVNGRIMIDPAIFRRINPNYPISTPKAKDSPFDQGDDEDEEGEGGGNDEDAPDTKLKVVVGEDDMPKLIEVPVDADGNETRPEKLDVITETNGTETKAKHEFTDEELMIASPVVLGFSFIEKLWLEFSLSGVRDIEWDEGAFASLVLPESHKSIVKALVESHKFHAAKTIDDVIQGKGKGLVAVLHGPPGTGKTLTAEGIAELLRTPLYMVSAGELGTDSRRLEGDLQNIMDLAHSWGAVLLLDEADVFLEKREVHDIHRNALVSIFLRLLEYFQGILFLTTNRVETFDDAFQSRIHVALRYGELSGKAKKAVWRMFLDRVRSMEGVKSVEWTDEELEVLSRKPMNGRQIKNAVRTAQALAVNNDEELSMRHLKHVLDVAQSFEKDLRGGTGYDDAMRSYT